MTIHLKNGGGIELRNVLQGDVAEQKMKILCMTFSKGMLQFTGFSLDIRIDLKNGGD
jgi:hypothetical protein